MQTRFRFLLGFALAFFTGSVLSSTVTTAFAQANPADSKPSRWEPVIQAMEDKDRQSPPPKQANLFIGSSTIRLWDLAESFPDHVCVNRGFGGSQMGDMLPYCDRLVLPHNPRVVFLYNGDNDIAAGKKAESVRDNFVSFMKHVHEKLPEAKLVSIGIKPSPKRWELREEALKANRLIQAAIKSENLPVTFVDVWPMMLGGDGLPKPEFYVKDQLHLTPAGYASWEPLIKPLLVGK